MNGNIMMGFGVALGVWGLVALIGYEKLAEGFGLIAVGIGLVLLGRRQAKRGQ